MDCNKTDQSQFYNIHNYLPETAEIESFLHFQLNDYPIAWLYHGTVDQQSEALTLMNATWITPLAVGQTNGQRQTAWRTHAHRHEWTKRISQLKVLSPLTPSVSIREESLARWSTNKRRQEINEQKVMKKRRTKARQGFMVFLTLDILHLYEMNCLIPFYQTSFPCLSISCRLHLLLLLLLVPSNHPMSIPVKLESSPVEGFGLLSVSCCARNCVTHLRLFLTKELFLEFHLLTRQQQQQKRQMRVAIRRTLPRYEG